MLSEEPCEGIPLGRLQKFSMFTVHVQQLLQPQKKTQFQFHSAHSAGFLLMLGRFSSPSKVKSRDARNLWRAHTWRIAPWGSKKGETVGKFFKGPTQWHQRKEHTQFIGEIYEKTYHARTMPRWWPLFLKWWKAVEANSEFEFRCIGLVKFVQLIGFPAIPMENDKGFLLGGCLESWTTNIDQQTFS